MLNQFSKRANDHNKTHFMANCVYNTSVVTNNEYYDNFGIAKVYCQFIAGLKQVSYKAVHYLLPIYWESVSVTLDVLSCNG